MTANGNWISPAKIPADWKPATASGWHPKPEGILTIPGTDQPLAFKIDAAKYPKEAAPVLFEMMNRFTDTYEEFEKIGLH